MRTQTTRITFVSSTTASMRDALLTCNGAYSLDDAVQMDAEWVSEAIENGMLQSDITEMLVDLLGDFSDTSVFQFTP